MGKTSINGLVIATCSILLLITAADVDSAGNGEIQLSWMFPETATENSICDGTIGECAAEEDGEEFEMESETIKRILARRSRYISYGALRRNYVPCSRRGCSYYNCRPGRAVNPYHRGCSHITRCRG